MMIIVALFLAAAVLGILVSLQPSTYHVSRSASLAAPAGQVFDQVNTLKNWERWSPWMKLDPAMKKTYDGPSSGTGASTTWNGNQKAGEGRMTIVESRPNDLLRLKLEFVRPFAAAAEIQFTFEPAGEKTAATWTMSGANNCVGKAFCLFINQDKMIGKDFETGLAQLEKAAQQPGQRTNSL
jgi:Polyketide cyclase / dehydrase and lipid transport